MKREKLLEMLKENSVEDVARICGVVPDTVRTWLLKLGIRGRKELPVMPFELERLISSRGKAATAKKLGISPDRLIAWMRMSGIAEKHPHRVRPIKEEIEPLLNRYRLSDIADMYMVTPSTVSDWIKKLEIKRKPMYR